MRRMNAVNNKTRLYRILERDGNHNWLSVERFKKRMHASPIRVGYKVVLSWLLNFKFALHVSVQFLSRLLMASLKCHI